MTLRSIALIDFSHALRVQYHVSDPDGGPTQAGQRTLDQLSEWRRSFGHVVVCLDSPVYWRKTLFEGYKSSRERDAGYTQVCKWTKERLIADGYSVAAAPTFEADDVISSLALKMRDHAERLVLIGGDKDMAQCVTDKVIIMAPLGKGEWEERDADWVFKKYGVAPERMAILQAITGDGSDDVPGIKGIGVKGAAKLITEYGSFEKMRLAAVKAFEDSQVEGAKPLAAFWKKFLDGAPNLDLWLQLTTLRTDVPLDVEALLTKQAIKPLVKDDVEDWDEIAEREAIQAESNVTETPKESVVPEPSPYRAPETWSPAERALMYEKFPELRAKLEAKTEAPKDTFAPKDAQTTTRDDVSTGSTQAIVVDRPAPPSWALALQPATAKEAEIISAKLYNSRHYMALEHAPGVLAIILKGRELGLGMMAALEMFFLVKGRPFPSAKGLRFLAERDPNCEWIMVTSADETHATVKTKHRQAGVLEYTYTAERARKAGYFAGGNKHNWNTLTQEMLEARATSKAVNRWYSGATFGMQSSEEMSDREEVESE